MPGCRRCHLRLNASVQRLEDNLKRYVKSPVMIDAVPECSCAAQAPLFHGRVSMRISSTNDQTLQV